MVRNGNTQKMRGILCIVLITTLLYALVGCGDAQENSSAQAPNAPSTEQPAPQNATAAEPPAQQNLLTAESDPEPPAVTQAATTQSHEITHAEARTYVNSIGTVWVQSIFEVTNTGGVPLFLSSGAYDLEDENGALVASRTLVSVYPTVIDPGEKAYYYEETTLRDLDTAIDVTILPRPDVKTARVENVRFPVIDFVLSDGQHRGINMRGRIENTSDEAESMIYIAAVLYDASDAPVGLISTILTESLAPGAKVGFESNSLSLPSDVTPDSIARYEVFAYPLQFQFA